MSRKAGEFIGYFTQMSADEIADHYDETTADHRGESMRKTGQGHGDEATTRTKWQDKMHDLLMQMEALNND